MNIEQAEEMVEVLQRDSMLGIDSLGGYGDDVAIALHKELLSTRHQLAIAREALRDIRDLWNDTQDAEIANQALDAIEKGGE